MSRFNPPLRRRAALSLAAATALGLGAIGYVAASDHKDGPITTENPAIDIADMYAFRSPADPGKVVLVMTVHGFIPPAEAGSVSFDPNLLYQFKIDTNGDAVADRVIQAQASGTGAGQTVEFRGPAAPLTTGSESRLLTAESPVRVRFTSTGEPEVASGGGMRVFAGVRDDPFFFDFARYQQIDAGKAEGFRNPGLDTFAGTNVLALVVEVPASALGANPEIGVWATVGRPASAMSKDAAPATVFNQVDRFGLPGNTVVFIPKPLAPKYNRDDPRGDQARYRDEFVAKLVKFGQTREKAVQLANMLLPDMMKLNTAQPTDYPNGRKPSDDVIDANLMQIFGGNSTLNSDNVAGNDTPFPAGFPYLAAPHTS